MTAYFLPAGAGQKSRVKGAWLGSTSRSRVAMMLRSLRCPNSHGGQEADRQDRDQRQLSCCFHPTLPIWRAHTPPTVLHSRLGLFHASTEMLRECCRLSTGQPAISCTAHTGSPPSFVAACWQLWPASLFHSPSGGKQDAPPRYGERGGAIVWFSFGRRKDRPCGHWWFSHSQQAARHLAR